jgi:heterodisulfide reductase subunit C
MEFPQVFFIAVAGITILLFARACARIYRNINLGRAEHLTDNFGERLKNMTLVALGQKKMFKNMIPAVLHIFIYVAFVITQIELIEIFIDGATGHHRVIYHAIEHIPFLKVCYIGLISFIELLSVLALIATFAFLSRRNLLKIPRFTKPELSGWPTLDANLILFFEIYLVTCIFCMNAGDMALNNMEYGFPISGLLAKVFMMMPQGIVWFIERAGWWGHILGVLAFLIYLPNSKHLHILLAFPNTFFARLQPKGYMSSMPEITKEVKLMMNPDMAFAAPTGEPEAPVKFGAKDVFDLSWKNLLDAYSCTECGRCTAACPANLTGKKLSPRKIMMDTRDRLEEVSRNIDKNNGIWQDDGKSLIENGYITVEELRACTTCNACVEECPIMITPLDIILQLRRNLVMEDSNAPAEWAGMFSNMENNGAPWQFSPQDRLNWVKE